MGGGGRETAGSPCNITRVLLVRCQAVAWALGLGLAVALPDPGESGRRGATATGAQRQVQPTSEAA